MRAYCTENFLSRGRTNHNIGRRFTYLICAHDGCNVKMRLMNKLHEVLYLLEAGKIAQQTRNSTRERSE